MIESQIDKMSVDKMASRQNDGGPKFPAKMNL